MVQVLHLHPVLWMTCVIDSCCTSNPVGRVQVSFNLAGMVSEKIFGQMRLNLLSKICKTTQPFKEISTYNNAWALAQRGGLSLWKESLNSDGQQFHQYQQSKQSPLTSNNWTQKDHDIWHWKFLSWLWTSTKKYGKVHVKRSCFKYKSIKLNQWMGVKYYYIISDRLVWVVCIEHRLKCGRSQVRASKIWQL